MINVTTVAFGRQFSKTMYLQHNWLLFPLYIEGKKPSHGYVVDEFFEKRIICWYGFSRQNFTHCVPEGNFIVVAVSSILTSWVLPSIPEDTTRTSPSAQEHLFRHGVVSNGTRSVEIVAISFFDGLVSWNELSRHALLIIWVT